MQGKCFLLLITVFVIYGCSNKNRKEQSAAQFTIIIEETTPSGFDLGKISNFHSIIHLETTDDSLIGQIEKISILDSMIVIWDSNTGKHKFG